MSLTRHQLVAVGVLALLAFSVQLHPLGDEDVWWHLWGGAQVLEHGARSFADSSSFTQDGWLWADTEWGFQLPLLAAWRAAGPAGVTLFTALLAALSAGLLGLLGLRLAGERPWLGLACAALVVCCSNEHFEPRPQAAFLTLLPIALLLLELPRSRLTLVALLGLQILWSQTHSSHVLLPALAGAAAVGVLPRLGRREAGWLAATAGVLGLLALITGPRGVAIIHEVAGHAASDSARHLGDMRPTAWADLLPIGLGTNTWLWVILLLAAHGLTSRRVRLGDVLFAALGLLLLVTAVRFRAAAALLLLPLIARRSPGEAAARPGLERWLGLALLTLGLPATWLWAVGQHPGRAPGLGLDADRFPVEAAALLKDQGATGHLYNFYDDGGYLVWQLAPAVQVAIDGRTPTFHSPEHHALWRQSCRSLRTFEGMDARWGIDHALVQRDLPLCGRLADHPGWRAVHIDPRRVLFTRADGPLLPGVKLGDSGLCTW